MNHPEHEGTENAHVLPPSPFCYHGATWSGFTVIVGLIVFAGIILENRLQLIPSRRFAWIASSLCLALLAIVYPYVTQKDRPRPRIRFALGTMLKEMLISIPVWMVAMCCFVAVSNGLHLIGVETTEADERIANGISQSSPGSQHLMLYASIVISGPVTEELLFRGFFLSAFQRWMPKLVAVVAQAFLFAIAHDYSVAFAMNGFILGVVLGLAYQWRQSIWVPICVHVLVNGMVVTASLLTAMELGEQPVLGVNCGDLDQPCVVQHVTPGSPAELAGIYVGDKITGLGQFRVETMEHLTLAVAQQDLSKLTPIWFERNGDKRYVEVQLIKRRELRPPQ